ncbi:cAMP-dependent protein kinase catalytic subunit alpha-like [Macrosteles quadrilineatus]|uniref:cAMP-dependent protein kinase catalytic subunit alpha-like n=1 Tax=Macrosteles quadrilineatus TaxID=74068 RepID=UPI0023E33846|nr:cAMP-dependent protein kinase catalytic subunit alpha-like [Macrosteles quadrilineatus]
MNRFVDLIGWGNAPKEETYRFPDFGPVDIPNYKTFLEESRGQFFEKWASLQGKEEPVKLKNKQCWLKSFTRLKLIGSGSFGQVYLVKNEQTGNVHAMKAVLKKTVVELRQINNTRTEKLVLECSDCPFTMRLDYFFKDYSYLYFVLPFIQGGELFQHLQSLGKFDESLVMFYLSQVILALEYLHYLDIVYRDLKPENILLDHTGYIKLTDFGFCKHLKNGRTYTFCGTIDYLAPEIILNEGYGKAVDWWAVGVLAFELTTGQAPFKDKSEVAKLKKIVNGKYTFPSFMSIDLRHLITQALQKDLTRRYGNLKDGVDDFKNHKWFKPLNWQAVVCRKVLPSYVPDVEGPTDLKHCRKISYKSLTVADSLEYAQEFADF